MGRLYIGFMSGTSLDGLDASLVETDGECEFHALGNLHIPYPEKLKSSIKSLCANVGLDSFLDVEKQLTQYHIDATHDLLKQESLSNKDIYALGLHGQTIIHRPEVGSTLQIGNPHMLSRNTGINVIHDFRRRDLASGGQGAPLVPVFHKYLMKNQKTPAVVINIGGVANLTYIENDELVAFDTGPGNALIDDAVRKHFNCQFDASGKIASKGQVDINIVDKVMSDEYFNQKYPKSLDRNRFKYLMNFLDNHSPEDIISTLTYITSASIACAIKALPKPPELIVICGGGTKNVQMLIWLKSILLSQDITCMVENISAIDSFDSDYVESQAFAYLTARFFKKLPSTFPSTTGAKVANICGCLVHI